MGLSSGWHWILLVLVVLLLFGGGNKISSLMGDVAKGIKNFKKGMSEDDVAEPKKPGGEPRALEQQATRAESAAERSKTG